MPSVRAVIGKQLAKLYQLNSLSISGKKDLISFFQDCKQFNLNVYQYTTMLVRLIQIISKKEYLSPEEAKTLFIKILQLINFDDNYVKLLSLMTLNCLIPLNKDAFFATNTLNGLAADNNAAVAAHSFFVLTTLHKDLDFSYIRGNLSMSLHSSNPLIVAAGLILIKKMSEINSKACNEWVDEVKGQTKSKNSSIQVLAYDALVAIKSENHNFLATIVRNASDSSLDTSTQCFLIRLATKLAIFSTSNVSLCSELLKKCLLSVRYAVATQASLSVLQNSHMFTKKHIDLSITHLSTISTSSNAINRFAASKLLSQFLFSSSTPNSQHEIMSENLVKKCTNVLATLISDKTTSVAMMALSGYLKGLTLLSDIPLAQVVEVIDKVVRYYAKLSIDYKISVIEAFQSLSDDYLQIVPQVLKCISAWLMPLNLDESPFQNTFENQRERIEDRIVAAMIHIFALQIQPEMRLKILEDLSSFLSECRSEKTISRILEFFGDKSNLMNSSESALSLLNCQSFILLTNLIDMHLIAIHSILKIALNHKFLSKDIIIFLEELNSSDNLAIRSLSTIYLNLLSGESRGKNLIIESLDKPFTFKVDSIIDTLDQMINNFDSNAAAASLESNSEFSFSDLPLEKQLLELNVEFSSKRKPIDAILNSSHVEKIAVESIPEKNHKSDVKFAEELRNKFGGANSQLGKYQSTSSQIEMNDPSIELHLKYSKIIFSKAICLKLKLHNTVESLLMRNIEIKFETLPSGLKILNSPSIKELYFGKPLSSNIVFLFEDVVSLIEEEFILKFICDVYECDLNGEVNDDGDDVFTSENFLMPEINISFNELLEKTKDLQMEEIKSKFKSIPKSNSLLEEMDLESSLKDAKATLKTLVSPELYIGSERESSRRTSPSTNLMMYFAAQSPSEGLLIFRFDIREKNGPNKGIVVAGCCKFTEQNDRRLTKSIMEQIFD
ncbi:MAG: hypothetical protein MHMPM18_001701 [Marteilia pararefringens]